MNRIISAMLSSSSDLLCVLYIGIVHTSHGTSGGWTTRTIFQGLKSSLTFYYYLYERREVEAEDVGRKLTMCEKNAR